MINNRRWWGTSSWHDHQDYGEPSSFLI